METPNTAWMNFEASKALANLAAAGKDIVTLGADSTRPVSSPRAAIERDREQPDDPDRVQALDNLLNTVFREY